MTEFFADYGIFLAKTATFVIAALLLMAAGMAAAQRARKMEEKGTLTIRNLNRELQSLQTEIKRVVLDKDSFRQEQKQLRKQAKAEAKARRQALKQQAGAGVVEAPDYQSGSTPTGLSIFAASSTGMTADLNADSAQQAEVREESTLSQPDSGQQAVTEQTESAIAGEPPMPTASPADRPRLYVLDFEGDIRASEVENLRKAITAILSVARQGQDEVLLRLESTGGMVHAYGLAASQLQRIRDRGLPLTICVDKVAASGGYMMACMADHIIAAPFAILGSIGVLMQMPNFHRLLKDNKVDYEMITAGEYKRTLTLFGENTDKGREKMAEDIQEVHQLFKDFIRQQRSVLDVDQVATGETWFGTRALELQLVDELGTSDECLLMAAEQADVYLVKYQQKQALREKLSKAAEQGLAQAVENWAQKTGKLKFFS